MTERKLHKAFHIYLNEEDWKSQDNLISIYKTYFQIAISNPSQIYKIWMPLPQEDHAILLDLSHESTRKRLNKLSVGKKLVVNNTLKWFHFLGEQGQMIRVVSMRDPKEDPQTANQFKNIVMIHHISEPEQLKSINLDQQLNDIIPDQNLEESIAATKTTTTTTTASGTSVESLTPNQQFKLTKKKAKIAFLKEKLAIYSKQLSEANSNIQKTFEEKVNLEIKSQEQELLRRIQMQQIQEKDLKIQQLLLSAASKSELLSDYKSLEKQLIDYKIREHELLVEADQMQQENLIIRDALAKETISLNNERNMSQNIIMQHERLQNRYQRRKKTHLQFQQSFATMKKTFHQEQKNKEKQINHLLQVVEMLTAESAQLKSKLSHKNKKVQQPIDQPCSQNILIQDSVSLETSPLLEEVEYLQNDDQETFEEAGEEISPAELESCMSYSQPTMIQIFDSTESINVKDNHNVVSEVQQVDEGKNAQEEQGAHHSKNDENAVDHASDQERHSANDTSSPTPTQEEIVKQQREWNLRYLKKSETGSGLSKCFEICQSMLDYANESADFSESYSYATCDSSEPVRFAPPARKQSGKTALIAVSKKRLITEQAKNVKAIDNKNSRYIVKTKNNFIKTKVNRNLLNQKSKQATK